MSSSARAPARPEAPPASTAGRPGNGAPGAGTGITTAVLFATAPAGDGPAAVLAWEETTVLRRLVDQLAGLGVRTVHVVTRAPWAARVEQALDGAGAVVHTSAAPTDDLRTLAALAREADGGLVLGYGEIVTHREALAGLLADPRLATGMLTTLGRRALGFRARSNRGRVVSASSPFHHVHRGNLTFLGLLKVSAADRPVLVDVAGRLGALVEPPLPPGWEDELERKVDTWRVGMVERARAAALPDEDQLGDGDVGAEEDEATSAPDEGSTDVALSDADEAEIRRRLEVVREDVLSLVLVGMVRSGVHIGAGHLRKLFWARARSQEAVAEAAVDIQDYDEEEVLLNSAVKASDGFFTTFFVSPYSKYIARWAARRGLTPNQITTASLLIGVLAAAAFATGERWGLVVGAILVQLSFTTDCVDGQLARYTRTFTKLGAWLDSVFDRTKEYVVFAGLAIGAERLGQDVWLLAGAALTLQTLRHTFDFSFAAAQHQVIGAIRHAPLEEPHDGIGPPPRRGPAAAAPAKAPAAAPAQPQDLPRRVLGLWRRLDRAPGVLWVKRMVAFPIGERFAVISITAALFTPQTTFIVLLACGGFAAAYQFTGKLLRAASR